MVFWSEYIGGPCPVNVCCTGKGFPHCGKCPDVPCALILDNQDPNNSCEENEEILNRCLESLAFLG